MRMYVTMYWRHTKGRPEQNGETAVDSATAARIAWDFAASHFPNWGDQLQLTRVQKPLSRSAGGIPQYHYHWTGQRDGAETGDWVVVSVSTTGQIMGYLCNAARHHTRDEVTVPRWRALAKVRGMIRERADFDPEEVQLSAKLVLSYPFAPHEGPVCVVTATRPSRREGWSNPRLTRHIDAVTGEEVSSPLDTLTDDSYFFHAP